MPAKTSTPQAPGYTCTWCSRLFHRPASSFKRSRRIFCSLRCSGKAFRLTDIEGRDLWRGGIYAIVYDPTGGAYIGGTRNLARRKVDHWSALQSGRHTTHPLQDAWNEVNGIGFTFRVLEDVDDIGRLIDREQAWLERYRADGRPLFNLAPNAGTNAGIEHAEEIRAQMRANPKRKFRGKLSEDEVRAIKRRALNGEDFHQLAAEFNIHRHTVYMIATDRMWPDVQ